MSIIYFGSCGEDCKFTKKCRKHGKCRDCEIMLSDKLSCYLTRALLYLVGKQQQLWQGYKKGCTKILILIHPRIGDDDWSGSDHGGDSGGGGYGLEVAEAVDKERPASFGCLEVLHDVIADLVGIQRDDFAGDAVCFPDLCGKCGIGIDAYAHKTRIRIFARLRCVGYKTVGHTRSCVGCRPEIEEHLVSF